MPVLFREELRKLRGIRYFTVLLILLFAGNLYICYRDGAPLLRFGWTKESNAALATLADLYREDKETYEKTAAAMEAADEAYLREEAEKRKNDPSYQSPLGGSHYYSADANDSDLLHRMEMLIEAQGSFDTQIEQIIWQSERSMRDMKLHEGLSMDDYRYLEQAYIHHTYKALTEQTAPVMTYVYGWDALFSFHYGDMLLMAVLLLLSSLLFLPEKQMGMLPILRCTKKGGGETALAKLGVMSVLSVGITLLFFFGTMAVTQLTCGFSDWNVTVQSIPDFTMFPRAYRIKEYFFLFLGMKLLGALAFSAVCTFLASLFYHPILSYGSGAALAGFSFWMYNLPLSVRAYLPQQLNLFSIMAVKPLSVRLRTVNFFGEPVQSISFAVFETVTLFLLFSTLTVVLHSRGGGTLRFAGFTRAVESMTEKGKRMALAMGKTVEKRFRARDAGTEDPAKPETSPGVARKPRRYAHSILGWELHKVFFGELLLIIALVMIVAQVRIDAGVREDYRPESSYRVYKMLYLPKIEGPLTEETGRYLEQELETERSYSENADAMDEAYKQGELTDEEYLDFRESGERARYLIPILEGLLARRDDFVRRMETEESAPGHFIDYEGYEALLQSGFSIPLFAVLLFVCAASFAKEYGGKSKNEHFAVILRSTYRGQGDTFRKKCLACCLVGLLAGAVFYGIELGFYLSTYDFPTAALGAPLFSLKAFGIYHGGISLLSALLLVYAMKFAAIILTVLLLCAISALCKNLLQGLVVSLLSTMLPSLLVYLGLWSARYISYAEWMAAGPMLHFSMEADLFGGDLGLYTVYTLAVTAITALLLLFAARQHSGGPILKSFKPKRKETTV